MAKRESRTGRLSPNTRVRPEISGTPHGHVACAILLVPLALLTPALSACGPDAVVALFAPQEGPPDTPQESGSPEGPSEPRDASPQRFDAGGQATPDAARPPRDAAPQDGALSQDGALQDGALPRDGALPDDMRLLARYDFSGTGTRVVDLLGGPDAVVLGGAALSGSGTLTLDGVDDHVDLPNRLISPLGATTIMVWMRWAGGGCWQRIFDFGSSDQPEGESGDAQTSLFLTPLVCGRDAGAVLIEFDTVGFAMHTEAPLPSDQLMQVTLTLDPTADTTRLYVNGVLSAEAPAPFLLSRINDVNAWLGRSQWSHDPYLKGEYDELRIYQRALRPDEVQTAFERGPDTL